MSLKSRKRYADTMVRKHDNITNNLEQRIKKNFTHTETNVEYGDYCVIGEIDLRCSKTVNGKKYEYIFETKCNDTYKAEQKAYDQTHRALDRHPVCKAADVVLLYYVTNKFVRNIGVYKK